jgi:hypothetical protein
MVRTNIPKSEGDTLLDGFPQVVHQMRSGPTTVLQSQDSKCALSASASYKRDLLFDK